MTRKLSLLSVTQLTLMNAYYMPDLILGTEKVGMNKTV